jgi:putative ABC transport system substrate-binding protein
MQIGRLKRREVITLLGGAVAAWPLAASGQRPVIGWLGATSAAGFQPYLSAFRQGLGDQGYIEGQNIAIEYRWAQGQYDRVPALAADLVSRQVAVIMVSGGDNPAIAAKKATDTIPILFVIGSDPAALGLVASLARPGGNATGVNIFTIELVKKRVGLLFDLLPAASSFGILINSDFLPAVGNAREAEAAIQAAGKQVAVYNARSEGEIDAAFATMAKSAPQALLVGSDPFFNSRRAQIVGQALRHAIPAIYEWREFAQAGGLISYGTSLPEAYHQTGVYAGRILKGEKAADLPVVQLTKFELVINLTTAKVLGLTIPPGILAIADEVIE